MLPCQLQEELQYNYVATATAGKCGSNNVASSTGAIQQVLAEPICSEVLFYAGKKVSVIDDALIVDKVS